jgi:hypothetical protein
MRSFAAVAVNAAGEEHDTLEAVLEPLPGAAPNPDTLRLVQTQPEAWTAATTDPRHIQAVMDAFATWVGALPRPRMFAASPVAFDGGWIDYYLRRFTRYGLVQVPYESERLFDGPGLCLGSYAAAVTRRPMAEVSPDTLPPEWLGSIEHTHCALDDARLYAPAGRTVSTRAEGVEATFNSWLITSSRSIWGTGFLRTKPKHR